MGCILAEEEFRIQEGKFPNLKKICILFRVALVWKSLFEKSILQGVIMNPWFFFLALFFSCFQLYSNTFTWNSAAVISNSGVDVSDPQVVIDPSGNITAVWLENGVLQSSVQPFGGSWSTPVAVTGSGASSPALGIDGSGNATAVWILGDVVQTSTLPLNGSWDSSTTLSDTGAVTPAIAVDSSGNAVVAWQRNGFIESKTRFSGNWGLVYMLSAQNSDPPDVAISDGGTAVVVWHSVISGVDTIVASTSIVGSTWSNPVNLTSPSVNALQPRVAIDSHGNGTAVWFQYDKPLSAYTKVQVFASSLQSNTGNWTVPVAISDTGSRNPNELPLALSSDANGNAVAVWSNSPDGAIFNVETSQLQSGSSWAASVAILGGSYYAVALDLAVSPDGQALVAAMSSDQPSSGAITLVTQNSYIAGYLQEYWSGPQTVSSGSDNGYPVVATSVSGTQVNGTALWLSYNGTNIELQAVAGTKPLIDPPSNLAVQQVQNSFGVYSDYSNILTWTPSSAQNIVSYVIYRNGVYVTRVEDMSNMLVDHNDVVGGPVTYGVATLDNTGGQSQTIYISYP